MKRKIIIILFSVLLLIACIIFAIITNNKSSFIDYKKKYSYKKNNIKCQTKYNKNFKKKSNKKNSKVNNKECKNNDILPYKNTNIKTNDAKHNHAWKVYGHYVDEYERGTAEPATNMIASDEGIYICNYCSDWLYPEDIKNINDLRDHINNCTGFLDDKKQIDKINDNEILNMFCISKYKLFKIFQPDGYKCQKCGKCITTNEAYKSGIGKPEDMPE